MAEEEKKTHRDPFPDEIESEEEKHHVLNGYGDISEMLSNIRRTHLEGALFVAHRKSEELLSYISVKYASDANSMIALYEQHPRRVQILKQLNETRDMFDFMTSDKGWNLYKDDGHWKTEWQFNAAQSVFQSYRITGIGDVTLYDILAVIYEMDLIRLWMPLCKESINCGQLSLYSKCGMIRSGLIWPMWDRECVLFGYGIDDLENGRVLIYFDSRDDNPHVNIPKCGKKRIRVEAKIGGFLFERITQTQTKVTVVWNMDPKLEVPVSIVNWFAGSFAAKLVQQIVNAAKFDETSEYYKRIQNNPEFYGAIKKKLDESKTMSDLKVAAVSAPNSEHSEEAENKQAH